MFVVEKWDTDTTTDDISKGISQKLPKLKKSKTKTKQTPVENVKTKLPNDAVQEADESSSLPQRRKRKRKGTNKFKITEEEQKLVGADRRSTQTVPTAKLKRKALSSKVTEAKLIKLDDQSAIIQKPKSKRKKKTKSKSNDLTETNDASLLSSNKQMQPSSSPIKSISKDKNIKNKGTFDDKSKDNSSLKDVNKRSLNSKSTHININKLREVLSSPTTVPVKKKPEKQQKHMSLADRMKEKLTAARFRFLNEQMYTQTGSEAQDLFREDPDAFRVYHEGFESQVTKWPSNPADRVIKYIRHKGAGLVVADFGCGDAKVAQALPNPVHSFDLVAVNSHVTACDMARVPLRDASVDICVFCLSLMGTNLVEYLCEASRILKQGGTLLIAEVVSRFDSIKGFVKKLDKLGFTLLKQDDSEKMFVWFDLRKTRDPPSNQQLPHIELAPCTYKKR